MVVADSPTPKGYKKIISAQKKKGIFCLSLNKKILGSAHGSKPKR